MVKIKKLKIIKNFIPFILLLFLLEIYSLLVLKHPCYMPNITLIKKLYQKIYLLNYRNIIQLLPECASYHPLLTYTLKPGEFIFKNSEFDTTYKVNSFGLRDDEVSLKSPGVIVLGDSFAMGWGVSQDDTYVNILEKNTKLKILNAGISSYGTVRELDLLSFLDFTDAKYIILQYCSNDFIENDYYVRNGRLKIMPESQYNSVQVLHAESKRYFPFKYSFYVFFYTANYIKKNFIKEKPKKRSIDEEVSVFLQVLKSKLPRSILHSSEVQLIIMGQELVINEINKKKKSTEYPNIISNSILINISGFLDPKDYFILDDHFNKSGHSKIAQRLKKYL